MGGVTCVYVCVGGGSACVHVCRVGACHVCACVHVKGGAGGACDKDIGAAAAAESSPLISHAAPTLPLPASMRPPPLPPPTGAA